MYPHRRVRLTSLIGPTPSTTPESSISPSAPSKGPVVVDSRGGESLVVEEGAKDKTSESVDGLVEGTEETGVVKDEDGVKDGVEVEAKRDRDELEEEARLKGLFIPQLGTFSCRVHSFTPFISPRIYTREQTPLVVQSESGEP